MCVCMYVCMYAVFYVCTYICTYVPELCDAMRFYAMLWYGMYAMSCYVGIWMCCLCTI